MCDPLSIGALAIGAAGTVAKSVGSANAAKKQEQQYNEWASYQKRIREQENVRQEDLRGKAETSRQEGVEAISADQQKAAQSAEEARLTSLLAGESQQPTADPRAPQSAADDKLTGTQGGGEVFQTELAKQLADASASAKQRIGALARVQSYGGSFGGLGTRNPIEQAQAGSGIDAANAMRKGSLGAYETETNVDPTQITYTPSPIADIASSFLNVGMGGLGNKLAGGEGLGTISSIFGGKVAPKFTLPTTAEQAKWGTRTGLF